MNKRVSVILPCYNEETLIEETLNKVLDFCGKNPGHEFIFVDDGSKDNTLSIIKKFSPHPQIRVISYNKNKGKGYAVRRGMMQAQGDHLIFTDSDLAYSLEHINVVSENLLTHEVVIGSRALSSKNTSRIDLFKIIRGITYNALTRLFLGLSYPDMQAGLKGFQKNAAKNIFSKQKINDFSFDPEIIYLARKKRYKIKEIPAEVSLDHKTKPSQIKLVQDPFKMLIGLFRIKLNHLEGKYG